MSTKSQKKLAAIILGQIEEHGEAEVASVFLDVGLKLNLLAAHQTKILGVGDKTEYLPAGAWMRIRTNAGAISYKVTGNGTRHDRPRVVVTHKDGSTQTHPTNGNYKIGDEVFSDGNVLHFPS